MLKHLPPVVRAWCTSQPAAATMQTRSMTRKSLTRSASLDPPPSQPSSRDARASVPPALPAPPLSREDNPPVVLEVVSSSDAAIIEHVPPADVAVHDQHARAQQVQQHMLHMMQAVSAETHRNTEARLHRAFAETEARLQQTAQALVHAHAKEQAQETRRDLEEAIQIALIDAHTQAHNQAMEAAQDRLAKFTAEINAKIQDQLAQAVNEVSTKGVAYMEGVTAKSLEKLRVAAQKDISDGIQHAVTNGILPERQLVAQASRQLVEDTASLQRQLLQVQTDLPVQLAASEKRCYAEAVSTASVHAERLVSQAEGRLLEKIEDRMARVERRAKDLVGDAVVRAETHCNVVEKRAKESIERAVQDLYVARQSINSNPRQESGLSIDQKLDRRAHELLNTELLPMMEKMAAIAVQSRLSELVAGKLEEMVAQQVESKLQARVRSSVAAALQENEEQVSIKMQSRVRAVVDQVAPVCVDEQLATKLPLRVRSAVAHEVPALFNELLAAQLPSRVRATVPEQVDDYLASKLQPRVRAMVAAATADHIEDEVSPKLQASLREMANEVLQEQVDTRVAAPAVTAATALQFLNQQYDAAILPRVERSIAEATTRLELSLDRQLRQGGSTQPAPLPVYIASPAVFAAMTPSGVMSSGERRQDDAADQLACVNKALKLTYSRSRPDNQAYHGFDDDSGLAKNPRALLAARQQAKERTRASFDSSGRHPDPPVTLASTRSEDLQQFLTEFKLYRELGGEKAWTAFASPAILQYLKSVECPEGFSDQQIFSHLQQKADAARNDVSVLEKKFGDIRVDPKAKTSREKAESILLGVESVLYETNPNVPVTTLINIVMEKLPKELRASVQRQMKFLPPIETKREFAKLLMDEAMHFKWPPLMSSYVKREES